jgi:tRNA-dihydrouridine synthase
MEFHLAPMENVSCWAFRKLCTNVSDSYTGMLSLNNLIRRNNAWREVDTFKIEEQRQWIQVATSKEKECKEFILKLNKIEEEKKNIYGIQLNVSCPSKELIKIGQGAALIKRAKKVSSLVQELLNQDKFKIGLKVRLGLNKEEVKKRKIITLFEELEKIKDSNFSNVCVHFKHAQERSSTDYDYSILKDLIQFNIPLIANGGIRNNEEVEKFSKIKGIMIGRGALGNPNCFSELINLNLNRDIKEEFEENCKEHMPKPNYLETIKKYCEWYS